LSNSSVKLVSSGDIANALDALSKESSSCTDSRALAGVGSYLASGASSSAVLYKSGDVSILAKPSLVLNEVNPKCPLEPNCSVKVL
jgi:hypothetical protein